MHEMACSSHANQHNGRTSIIHFIFTASCLFVFFTFLLFIIVCKNISFYAFYYWLQQYKAEEDKKKTEEEKFV